MKLSSLLNIFGAGAAPIVNTASSLAIALGVVYLVDCRITARTPESVDRCYFTALPLMGIGAAGKGGFNVGYSTFNPALHRPEDEAPQRDAHGRFTKREG